jgi:hypothetical protein
MQFPKYFQTQYGFTRTRRSNNMQPLIIKMIINGLQHSLLIRAPRISELHLIENHHHSFFGELLSGALKAPLKTWLPWQHPPSIFYSRSLLRLNASSWPRPKSSTITAMRDE